MSRAAKAAPPAELWAAPRDASFLRCPGRAGKFHAVVERNGYPAAACGSVMLYMDGSEPAAGLLPFEKCSRPGCKEAFAAGAQS